MNKQAQVGLFTLVGLAALFSIFYVLSGLGSRISSYHVPVEFKTASGLRKEAQVYLSGVPVGSVDHVELNPQNYAVRVVLSIRSEFAIPENSRYLIQAPLTGEPTVLIEPPKDATSVAVLPKDNTPLQQGYNPATFSDLLEQGQGEVRRLDDLLAQLQTATPKLLSKLTQTLDSTNELTRNANASLAQLSNQASSITDTLNHTVTAAGGNVVDLTSTLDSTVKSDAPKIDELLAELQHTSLAFGQTVDSLKSVATDPQVKRNLVETTHSFALTAKTFAELTGDLRQVTGNPQTQSQLRDAVAQIDATTQKVDSLVGGLGGTSHVYGVDPGATPGPGATPWPPGYVPTSQPALPVGSPAPGGSNATGSSTSASPGGTGLAALRTRLNSFTKDLVQLQIRVSALTPSRPGSANRNVSPLLTSDRGPQSDFNLTLLPRGGTSLIAGVNDIGSSGTATANLMLEKNRGPAHVAGGILYSRLGGLFQYDFQKVGLETRVYDLRHPTADFYTNLLLAPKLQLFGGERDLIHSSRRTTFGVQFEL
jgi:phospholipid/cholesterol/gamma-HCH transport system substrate-binding protein